MSEAVPMVDAAAVMHAGAPQVHVSESATIAPPVAPVAAPHPVAHPAPPPQEANAGADPPGTHIQHQPQPQHQHHLAVVLPLEEFAEDLDLRLGRANGNIFYRRPGIPGVHDGQVMVRLKKKRFIVIDYSIVPTEADVQAAAMSSHISCPPGAGVTKCNTSECSKIGVPVLLYDSDPNEPSSLYMRSGLCFTCQRNLNEKRRTQRKRSSDPSPSLIYAIGPGHKRFKMNGSVIDIHNDAIIINGAAPGTKHHGEGYTFHEIGVDLHHLVREVTTDTDRLLSSVSNPAVATAATHAAETTAMQVSHSDPSSSAAVAAHAVATTAALAPAAPPPTAEAAAAAVQVTAATTAAAAAHHHPPSTEDINALYVKAFHSMNKAIFLLSQWKQSWDTAIANAVAQESVVTDPGLADAVASAAAVAAVASAGAAAAANATCAAAAATVATEQTDQNSTNMVSLLLAADQRKDDVHPKSPATAAAPQPPPVESAVNVVPMPAQVQHQAPMSEQLQHQAPVPAQVQHSGAPVPVAPVPVTQAPMASAPVPVIPVPVAQTQEQGPAVLGQAPVGQVSVDGSGSGELSATADANKIIKFEV